MAKEFKLNVSRSHGHYVDHGDLDPDKWETIWSSTVEEAIEVYLNRLVGRNEIDIEKDLPITVHHLLRKFENGCKMTRGYKILRS